MQETVKRYSAGDRTKEFEHGHSFIYTTFDGKQLPQLFFCFSSCILAAPQYKSRKINSCQWLHLSMRIHGSFVTQNLLLRKLSVVCVGINQHSRLLRFINDESDAGPYSYSSLNVRIECLNHKITTTNMNAGKGNNGANFCRNSL